MLFHGRVYTVSLGIQIPPLGLFSKCKLHSHICVMGGRLSKTLVYVLQYSYLAENLDSLP